MLSWTEYLKIVVAMLAVLNPLIAAPVFAELTSGEVRRRRVRIALVASVAVFLLLVVSALTGEFVLRLFGISLEAFQVGGGLLVLLMAIGMLQARGAKVKQTDEETHEAEDKESIAVVPLAIPLIAGPGALSTMVMYSYRSPEVGHKLVLCVVAFLMAVVVFAVLRASNSMRRALGTIGINVASRLLGLLLAAIGVEFIATGLKGLFPGLG
ncbi:MAG: NAAT family transporter [Verrucomicrobia bacterium]|nr:NAAT family transporter [Verrucomicrobiota bacterium]